MSRHIEQEARHGTRAASLQRKKQRFTAWTTKPLPKTTTALDQLFKFLDRKLCSMQTLRTGLSARATVNAWAIVRNFWRYLPGAKRAGQSPVEIAGADLQGIPWLQVLNLLTVGAWSQA